MPQASLQSSILGDGTLLGAMKKGKKGGINIDAILGGGMTAAKNSKADFSALLLGVQKAKQGDLTSAVLTNAPVELKGVDINVGPILENLPPEVAAVLKKLNITALKNVPQQIASLFNKAAAPASENTQAFIDALAKLGAGEPIPAEMFQLIDDPKLAALLQGLNTLVQQAHEDSVSVDDDGMVTILFEDGLGNKPAATALPAGVGTPAIFEAAKKEMQYFENNTITIADLDGDAFQNLKKLMFADIAPYLTAPRTVRISDGTVMKIAQGPRFLTDDDTDATVMAGIAGLMPSLPPQTLAALQGASSNLGIAEQEDTIILPAFLNSDVLNQAQNAGKPVKHSDMFAALLGVAQTKAGAANQSDAALTPQTGAVNTDPSAVLAKNPVMPAVAAQAGAVLNTHAGVHAANTPSTAATRGIEMIAAGLDTNLTTESASFDGLESALRMHADQSQNVSNATANMMAARTASQPHPSTHLMAAALQRVIASEMPAAAGTERAFSIQLDPENLGRVKITLEFGENNSIKAKLLAERPETLSLLQKDSAQLEKALASSGIDANRTDLSFDLAGGDTFSGAMHDQGSQTNGGSKGKKDDGTEFATIETVMPVFVDPDTGLTHLNVVV